MSTLDLLRRLYVNGSGITIADDGIRLSGHRPPDDLLEALKARKDDVLAELKAQRLGTLDADFDSAVKRRYVVPPNCLAQRACTRLGPCSRWLMRRHCNPFAQPDTGKDGEAA